MLLLTGTTTFAQVDSTIGIKAPKKTSRDVKKLAHYLCDTIQGDARKVNAIYNWVTHNIKYDVSALQRGDLKRPTTKQVLKKKKALCDGYSDLFTELCNESGVRALTINGYARDWMFDDSDKFYTPRHAWNAVAVANTWYLVDVTWGAGVIGQFPNKVQRALKKASKDPVRDGGKLRFKFQYDPQWLMAAPGSFRMKHLPYDPLWQLTDSLMPLQLFEAGESSIAAFNEVYGRGRMDYTEQNRFSRLPEHLRIIEEAERAYAYNPRFHVSMAMQHQGNAIDSIAALEKNAAPATRKAVVAQVQQELKTAEKYVALQKTSIATEYTELKKKNKRKNTLAKSAIQKLNNNNKQAITACKAKIKSSDTRFASLNDKAGKAIAAHKKIRPDAFRSIKTNTPEDKPGNQRLTTLEDSVRNRLTRLKPMQEEIMAERKKVDQLVKENDTRLDNMVAYLVLADSALVQETIGRINLHDNYDADIKKWSTLYQEARMQHADTLKKHYFSGYDSVLAHYEKLRQAHQRYLDQYRKNFKDLEQYKSRNATNNAVLAQYDLQYKEYEKAYAAQAEMFSRYGGYIKGNKSLLERLVKHYEHQEKLAGYMERSEEHRQKLEETTLTKKEAFDKKENEYQKKQLEEAATKAERYINKKGRA